MRFPKTLLAGAAIGLIYAGRKLLRNARRIDFNGKVVVITGGSRGLGLALARAFALEGARLAICARTGDQLDAAEEELSSLGADVIAQQIDVTDPEACRAFIADVRREWGQIDILVNNAGQIQVGPYNAMERADYAQSLDIHFWAPFNMIEATLPHMRERRQGRIVNIASIGGKVAVPHLLPYSTGKHALVGFSEGLRDELLREGLYVTTVCPGLMLTGSHVNVQVKGDDKPAEYTAFKTMDAAMGVQAEYAASRILEGIRYGEAEVVFPFSARAMVVTQGLAPSLMQESLSLAVRTLPRADGIGALTPVRGQDIEEQSKAPVLESELEQARHKNNQS